MFKVIVKSSFLFSEKVTNLKQFNDFYVISK